MSSMHLTEALGGVDAPQFRRRNWLAIGGGFLLLTLAAIGAVSTAISEGQISQASRESRTVRDEQNEFFEAIQEAETGQRGYLLTGDMSYLEPFTASKARLPALEAQLLAAAASDTAQRQRILTLKGLADQKLAELSQAVALRRVGDVAGALSIVKTHRGRDLMAKIRAESAAFDATERRYADRRRRTLTTRREALIWTVFSALCLTIGLGVFVYREIRLYAAELDGQYNALMREADSRAVAEAQLRQVQKMEALGQLTGGVAHDFNNMLAIVVGNLDMLIRRLQAHDERVRALAENALSGANKAAALTKSLLAFSRLQPLRPQPTDVNECVSEISQMLRRSLGVHIAIETVLGDVWRAFVDHPQLESAILNLAINARDAMPLGGKLTISTSNTGLQPNDVEGHEDLAAGDYVLIRVADTGTGMTPEVARKVFEPFFTTKAVGSGTGLGLSQVHGFIKQSGGHIKIDSAVGVGTTVELYLPRDFSMVAPLIPPQPSQRLSDNAEFTVLVVEDDPDVRSFATSAARELGYKVVEADNASVALERLRENPSISVLLTDMMMPGLTGSQLVDQALKQRRKLPVVYMTGYMGNPITNSGALEPGTRLLTKPFTLSDLNRELSKALSDAARPA